MVASVISICNSALAKIGAERISDLTEDNKRAKLCNEQYDKIRDEMLRAHPWNFAVKRVELAKLSTVPLFEYSCEFNLPSDCLRVIAVNPERPYQIEGRKLLSNSTLVQIKYISKIEDVYAYDSNFLELLSARLAAELAYSMVQSVNFKQELMQNYKEQLALARSYDAQEGTPEKNINDVWLDSRTAGIGIYE